MTSMSVRRTLLRTLAASASVAAVAAALGVPADAAPSAAPKASPPPHPRVAARAVSALLNHPKLAHAVSGQAFHSLGTIVDSDGDTHVRLSRSVQGLPVIGGDVVVHQGAKGQWDGVSQTLSRRLTLSVTPKVTAKAAGRAAVARDKQTRDIHGMKAGDSTELVIDALSGTPRLAWQVVTGGRHQDGTPSRMLTYVDARTGDVLRREEQIETVDGDGESLYSGDVPLQLTQSGSSYLLKDPTRGGTYTIDVNNKSDGLLCGGLLNLGIGCATGPTFSSTDTSFGNGSTSSRESAGVDAQYGTNETWDYYQNTFGRAGIFGNGSGSYNRVHYGKNYVNAFWDGKKMTYGDGDGVNYGPLTSLDVAGHEMSHGVTGSTAGLTYSGESGGLNEATSDIFGTMVEFYADNPNDPGDYLIGEQFDLNGAKPFRRMDDPASDGASADCWSSSVGSMDVHYSSGVGNHFFYLLAEGSGAKTLNGVQYDSPTCNGSTVTGIGRDAAQQIWYRALTVYMTSGTNYAGARTATLNAAADLYGASSTQYQAVAAAWSAVNVS